MSFADGMFVDVDEAVRALNERVATVHERVACPRCQRPIGMGCISLARGHRMRPLKHPHPERVRADGIPLR